MPIHLFGTNWDPQIQSLTKELWENIVYFVEKENPGYGLADVRIYVQNDDPYLDCSIVKKTGEAT